MQTAVASWPARSPISIARAQSMRFARATSRRFLPPSKISKRTARAGLSCHSADLGETGPLRQDPFHPFSRCLRILPIVRRELRNDALAVLEIAILAELELGFDARQRQAERHDAASLRLGVAGRQATEAPGLGRRPFV